MALNNQMEMFEDGGLRDQGDTIDPVSGNDVPSGSTQEEVRDDIPAQLSEGEFVLPADVVRFHGLEKIMALRDEAKAGLAKMEAMGQMGNSEEATMPDDMPFSMEDLDMEDDEPVAKQEGDSIEMAEGGFTNPTGTYQIPTNIASQPSYFQNYNQSVAPFQPFVPPAQQTSPVVTAATTANAAGPSFNTLMPTVGGVRETKEYRNEAGQKMFIPFIDGKPIYPIPEGYSEFTQETAPATQTTSQRSSSTQTRVEDSNDDTTLSEDTIRGKNGSLININFTNATKEGIQKAFNNMTPAQRALSLKSNRDRAKDKTGWAKTLAQFAVAVIPTALTFELGTGLYEGKSIKEVFDSIGKGDPRGLDALYNAFGAKDTQGRDPSDVKFAEEASLDEAFSQMIFGTDTRAVNQKYGVTPNYRKGLFGTDSGQFDPRTGGLYSDGQAVGVDGSITYSDFASSRAGFTASGLFGWQGGILAARDAIQDPTTDKKINEKAKKYIAEYTSERAINNEYNSLRGNTDKATGKSNIGDFRVSPNTFNSIKDSGYGITGSRFGDRGASFLGGQEIDVINDRSQGNARAGVPIQTDISEKTMQDIAAARAKEERAAQTRKSTREQVDTSTEPRPDTTNQGSNMDSSFGGSTAGSTTSGATGFGGGYGATYKGSLITRKQPSKQKPKKMKRGGLASRK